MNKRAGRTNLRANHIAIAVAAAFAPWSLHAQTPPAPHTLPTGGVITHGSGTINAPVYTPTVSTMQIDQTSARMAAQFGSFSIGESAHVNVSQPTSSSIALFKDVGGSVSQIYGRLTANGQLFVSNPNGVLIGRTGRVEAAGFIASTLTLDENEFMLGGNSFNWVNNGAIGRVTNEGTILTPTGYTMLAGPQVLNDGLIIANRGSVVLAAGDGVALDLIGDGLISVRVDKAALDASAINTGRIEADGGRVLLTARGANALLDTVINTSGVIRAASLVERNGEIVLDAGGFDGRRVAASGQMEAGNVSISGGSVELGGAIIADRVGVSAPSFGGPAVSQTASGSIEASHLDVFAMGGSVDLTGPNRIAGTLSGMSMQGDFSFTNTGELNATASAFSGNVTLVNAGALNVSNSVSGRNVTVTTTGAGSDLTVTGSISSSESMKVAVDGALIVTATGVQTPPTPGLPSTPRFATVNALERQEIVAKSIRVSASDGAVAQINTGTPGNPGMPGGPAGIPPTPPTPPSTGDQTITVIGGAGIKIEATGGGNASINQMGAGNQHIAVTHRGIDISSSGLAALGALGSFAQIGNLGTGHQTINVSGGGVQLRSAGGSAQISSGLGAIPASPTSPGRPASTGLQTITVTGGGGIDLEAQGGGNASINQTGVGAQILDLMNAGHIRLNGLSGSAVVFANGGMQEISTTGGITVGSAGASGFSQLLAGSQDVSAGSITIIGADAAARTNGFITLNDPAAPGRTQSIEATGPITIVGGNAPFQFIPPPPQPPNLTTSNAGIFHNSNGAQAVSAGGITLQGGTGINNGVFINSTAGGNQTLTVTGELKLTGGDGGNANRAGIVTNANQVINGNPEIILKGGAGGGAGNNSNNVFIQATGPDTTQQTINARRIEVTAGAGTDASATINAAKQVITALGDVSVFGSGGAGGANGARIGGIGGNVLGPTNVTLNVGGNLLLHGGSANGATLGSSGASTQANTITVNAAGNVTLASEGAGARIGSSNQAGATPGNISVTAGGSLELDSGTAVRANGPITLTADSLTNDGSITNGGGANTPNIILSADAFDLAGGNVQGGAAAVILRPRTGTNSFGIEAAGDTTVTNADIASINTSNFVVFGSGTGTIFTGNMTIGQTAQVDGGTKNLAFFRSSTPGGTTTIGSQGVTTAGDAIVSAGGGAIVSNGGTVSGDEVQLRASQGIGSATARVQTNANALAINNTGSQGAFVSEADNVTLRNVNMVVGGNVNNVANFVGAAGAYDVAANGALTVGGPISTLNGAITLNAGSLTNNSLITNGGGINTANMILSANAFDLADGNIQGGAAAVILRPRIGTNSFGIEAAGDTTLTNADIASINTSNFVVFGSGTGTIFTGNMAIGANAQVNGGGKNLAFFRSSAPGGTTTIGSHGVTTSGDAIVSAGGGAIVSSGGTVSADEVQLRASQGIGSAAARVQTNANALAINNTGSQGAFVREADNVTLRNVNLVVGGNINNVANFVGAGGVYDVAALNGAITVGGPIIAPSGVVNLSANGSGATLTEDAGGFIQTGSLTTFSQGATILTGPNQVQTFNGSTAFGAPSGDITLNNTGTLAVTGLSAGNNATLTNNGAVSVTGGWFSFGETNITTNGGNLAVISSLSSTRAMELDVGGTLTVSANGPQTAQVITNNGGQTIRAQAVEVVAQNGGFATITNVAGGEQRINVSGAGTSTGLDVHTRSTGGRAEIFQQASGFAQTIEVVNADHLNVNGGGPSPFAGSGAAIAAVGGVQTVSITGSGANAITLGSQGALGDSRIGGGQHQIVTAGAAGERGSITIVGPDANSRLAGFVSTPAGLGGTQTVSTTGLLRVLGGGASQASNFQSGVFHNGRGAQTVNAGRIELQGGSTGFNNGAFISSGNPAIHLGDQFITVTGDIVIAAGAGGAASIASGLPSTLQVIHAHNIDLSNAVGGTNSFASIRGGKQEIHATGDVTLRAFATNGTDGGVRIGGLSPNATDLDLYVGRDLILTGGSAPDNNANIGSTGSAGVFNRITIDAGRDVVLNSGSGSGARIGSGNTLGDGNIEIHAGRNIELNGIARPTSIRTLGSVVLEAASITEASNGSIIAGSLTTTTSGATNLAGANEISRFSATSGGPLALVDAGGLQVTGITTTNDTITLTTDSLTNTGVISNGDSTSTANIIFNADSFNLAGGTVEGGAAAVVLRPRTGTNSFGIEAAGATTLTNADIASIQTDNFIIFGSSTGTIFTGNMTIGENARVEGNGKNLAFSRSLTPSAEMITIGSQGVATTGDVIMGAGGGGIRSNGGTVTGDEVVLRASNGIGTPSARVKTAANALALNNAGGGGVFVSELDNVTLRTISLNAGGPLTVGNTNNGSFSLISGGDVNVAGLVSSGGSMILDAGGNLKLDATSADAELRSFGGQAITAQSINLTAENGRRALIQNQGGLQELTASSGGMDLQVANGAGVAQIVNISSPFFLADQTINLAGQLNVLGGATGGSTNSGIFQNGTGVQTVTAAGITLQGASTGTNAGAGIRSQGDQLIDVSGDINLRGGNGGTNNNAFLSANPTNPDAVGEQKIYARDINMSNGIGGVDTTATITARKQEIHVARNLTLTSQGALPGTAAGGPGVRIGGLGANAPTPTDLKLTVGGDLVLSGSTTTANNGVGIGSTAAPGPAFANDITIDAGRDVILNSGTLAGTGSRIGSSAATGAGLGDIRITAGGDIRLNGVDQGTAIRTQGNVSLQAASIVEASRGIIEANALTTRTKGDTLLTGRNQVASFTASSDTGNVSLTNTAPVLTLGSMQLPGSLSIVQAGTLSIPGTVSALSHSIEATGNVLVGSAGATSGALLYASGNISIETPGNVSLIGGSAPGSFAQIKSEGTIDISAGGNVSLVGGSGEGAFARILGYSDINLTVGGFITLGAGTGVGSWARVQTASRDSVITLNFPNLASGGYFVNGIEGLLRDGHTGFLSGNGVAAPGHQLITIYGAP
jgi:filamentous hemagglutinin family protein